MIDTTTAAAVLKTYYNKQRVEQLTYKDAPLYAMLDKQKDFFGATYPLPTRVVNPQNRSNTFSNAAAGTNQTLYKTFQLTRVHDYSLATIGTEAMLASESDAGAFLRLATAEIDGALDSLKRSISWSLYGTGAGNIGQVSATPSNNSGTFTVTLTVVEDVAKFEVGQTVVVYSALSGGSQRTSDGTVNSWPVAGVDRDQGIITLTGTYSGSGSFAANDYIFVAGDRGNKISGLLGWLPTTAPTVGGGDSWFGVDRSADATRLAGVRINCQGMPADEALINAARRMGREGADPDTVFSSYARYANLEKVLGQRVRYKEFEISGVGFKGIEISGPKRTMTVVPDMDCPANNQFMLSMDTWALYSLKEPIMLLNQDGNQLLRDPNNDAVIVRCGSYSQVGCSAPGKNGVLSY